MIVSFSSTKGGVGKTTTCVNLAYALATNSNKKYRVLVVDFDPQGGCTHHFSAKFKKDFKASIYDLLKGKCNVESALHSYTKELDLIPVSIKFKEFATLDYSKELQTYLINKVNNKYDFIFFDLAPSIYPGSTVPLSLSDQCIIPIYARGGLSLLGLQTQAEIIAEIKQTKNPKLDILGILACFVDRTKVSKEVVSYLSKWNDFFSVKIRDNTQISQASGKGLTIFEHSPKSSGTQDYKDLAKEFLKRIQERKINV